MTMLEDFVLHYGNLGDGADNIDVLNCFKLNSRTSFMVLCANGIVFGIAG